MESPAFFWISKSSRSHSCTRACSCSDLYSQWAAMPDSATPCISRVRIWISMGRSKGPASTVCRDW